MVAIQEQNHWCLWHVWWHLFYQADIWRILHVHSVLIQEPCGISEACLYNSTCWVSFTSTDMFRHFFCESNLSVVVTLECVISNHALSENQIPVSQGLRGCPLQWSCKVCLSHSRWLIPFGATSICQCGRSQGLHIFECDNSVCTRAGCPRIN